LIRELREIEKFLALTEEEKESFKKVVPTYPFSSTPYYLNLAKSSTAIRKMVLPDIKEIDEDVQSFGEDDPLWEEKDKKTPFLTHRYKDRVLLVTTNYCPVLCRFCMRKRNWKKPIFFIDEKEIDKAIDYIRKTPQVRDVLISGGEPLSLPLERLEKLLLSLKR